MIELAMLFIVHGNLKSEITRYDGVHACQTARAAMVKELKSSELLILSKCRTQADPMGWHVYDGDVVRKGK